MKYCSHCGTQLNDNAMFCPNCGCACENFNNQNQFYAQNNPQPAQNNNNSISALAIVGFVFAFLNALIGLICSIVAYKSAVTDGNIKSKNFAKTGIILSAVFLALEIILLIALVLIIVFAEPTYVPPSYEWYFMSDYMVNCL